MYNYCTYDIIGLKFPPLSLRMDLEYSIEQCSGLTRVHSWYTSCKCAGVAVWYTTSTHGMHPTYVPLAIYHFTFHVWVQNIPNCIACQTHDLCLTLTLNANLHSNYLWSVIFLCKSRSALLEWCWTTASKLVMVRFRPQLVG